MKRIGINIIIYLLFLLPINKLKGQISDEYLPLWQEGYLDIHQIATGRGNCTFIIMPDSTTMLIDAGDVGNKRTKMQALPDHSKLPGEWITIYINHFLDHFKDKSIDHALLTHFHSDHIGGIAANALIKEDRPYKLSGITEIREHLSIKKIVDRGWPDYNYPSRKTIETLSNFNNYLKFINYQHKRNVLVEKFEVGSNNQFRLCYNPLKYTNFLIQNIYSNGVIWTGVGDSVRNLFPDIKGLKKEEYPNENMCSNVIKFSYGKFDYYTGGDIIGVISPKKPSWWNVEDAVGEVVGKVDVAVANHHAYKDAMNKSIVNSLSPKVFIIPSWDHTHSQRNTIKRMTDSISEKRIYATDLSPKNQLESSNIITRPTGHIVTRVYTGGNRFQIFILNSYSIDYEIIFKTREIESN